MHRDTDMLVSEARNTTGPQYPGASCSSFRLQYVGFIDAYMAWHGTYDHEQVAEFDRQEREWKKTLPSFHRSELLKIFPTAKAIVREQIEQARADLSKAAAIESECDDIIFRRASREDEDFWNAVKDVIIVGPHKDGREDIIKRGRQMLFSGTASLNIPRAKAYPISELIDFVQNKAQCLWCRDADKDDMHYYEKDNHVFCFSCHKAADAIDVYRELHGCDFVTAVKNLI